jgi:hypothetical protein
VWIQSQLKIKVSFLKKNLGKCFNCLFQHTNSKLIIHDSIAVFPKTLYPGGIRTRSSAPETDAMSTAPRRQGKK